MTRIFEDTAGNEIPDIEFRLNYHAVVRVLLDKGLLTAEDVTTISGGRVIDVTAARQYEEAQREAAEAAQREAAQLKAEAEAAKKTPAPDAE